MSFGYPDWQSYPQWVGEAIYRAQAKIINAGPVTLVQNVFVSSWRSLAIFAHPAGGNLQLTFTWEPLTTDTYFRISKNYYFRGQSDGLVIIPNLSGTLVQIVARGSAVGVTSDIVIYPANLDPWLSDATLSEILWVQDAGIGGGANGTWDLPTYVGMAHIAFGNIGTATNFNVNIISRDLAGTVIGRPFISLAVPQNVSVSETISLPAALNEVSIDNNTATAGTVRFSVVAAPMAGG